MVTAYALAFGSLLLPGGRLADLLRRKVTFLTGLAGFAGVSAIGGASVNFAITEFQEAKTVVHAIPPLQG
jgi:MFS family permease